MTNETETQKKENKNKYTIEDVLPYSVYETDEDAKCKICGRTLNKHNYMDYFLHPPHVLAVRNFSNKLQEKHDKAGMLMLKLATTTSKSVLSPKEIQLQLIEKEYNPKFATQIIQQSVHYAPSQKFAFKHRGIEVKLFAARVRYDGFTSFWEHEFLCHKQLASDEEKTMERALEHVISQPFYIKFLKVHGLDAEKNYSFIQNEFHQITAKVNAHLKLTEEYLKAQDPLDAAAALNEQKYLQGGRSFMPQYMPGMYRYPRMRTVREPEA